jgi:tRNA-dihydrouridine synthase
VAHTLVPLVRSWGAQALTLHGRTRQQRYSRQADWDYIAQCAAAAPGLQLVGNGDVFSYRHWNEHMAGGGLASCMVARGALIKPWLFTGERLLLAATACAPPASATLAWRNRPGGGGIRRGLPALRLCCP